MRKGHDGAFKARVALEAVYPKKRLSKSADHKKYPYLLGKFPQLWPTIFTFTTGKESMKPWIIRHHMTFISKNLVTRGDPESPLRWTSKSVRKLADELKRMGHKTIHRMVAEILHKMEYSLQANRKTLEGSSHPDRDAQGARIRLWKTELQKFANDTGLEVSVCHLPPGTSKWNKTERLLYTQEHNKTARLSIHLIITV